MSNDTEVQTLTSFLLARVAEDEAAARKVGPVYSQDAYVGAPSVAFNGPARVLAECASKRAIVERYEFVAAAGGETSELAFHEQGLFEAVMSLAQIYVGHPDFRDEWRVES